MSITIEVKGYRGIDHALVRCDPICLVTSPNDAGKTSIAEAVAAALTGVALADHLELNMKNASAVVHSGFTAGLCVVNGEGGESRVSWPECKLVTSGHDHPHASAFAVGQKSIAQGMNTKERAAALERYLKSLPTKEDLTAAMQPGVLFAESAIDSLWEEIQTKGWDNTAGTYDQVRRDASREWSRITSETFGSDKSAVWKPAYLDVDVAVDELEMRVKEAEEQVDRAIAKHALGEAELSALRELAEDLDNRTSHFEDIDKQLTAAREEAQTALKERQALPQAPVASAVLACPCCGEKLSHRQIDNKIVLEKYDEPNDGELRKRRMAIAGADGAVSRTTAVVHTLEAKLTTASAAVKAATDARDKLALTEGKSEGSPELLAAARVALDTHKTMLRLRKQYDDASAAYRRWKSADLKLKLTQPDGLRAVKLGQSIHAFNDHVLAPLCTVAGWPMTTINEDLTVNVGDWPYGLRSEGIKWRARIILQAAMAQLDGSSMLVIDNMPDIDTAARNGLFRLLQHLTMPALVCAAEIKGVPVINLGKIGLGSTWLIKDGCTDELRV